MLALLLACSPGEGPDPGAVAALEGFIADPTSHTTDDFSFSGPAEATTPDALTALASDIDGHHDMVRAWVRYDGTLHWIFAQASADGVQWAAVVPPADDGVEGTEDDPVATYTAGWNATDPASVLAPIWAANARYVDPTDEDYGLDGLDRVITDFQDRFPRASILPDSAVLTQGELVHFRWRMEAPLIRMEGMDIGRVNADGQLTLIAGFFGALSPDE